MLTKKSPANSRRFRSTLIDQTNRRAKRDLPTHSQSLFRRIATSREVPHPAHHPHTTRARPSHWSSCALPDGRRDFVVHPKPRYRRRLLAPLVNRAERSCREVLKPGPSEPASHETARILLASSAQLLGRPSSAIASYIRHRHFSAAGRCDGDARSLRREYGQAGLLFRECLRRDHIQQG